MESLLRQFAIATVFLTRVPLRLRTPFGLADLSRAAWAFPLVGLAVGLATGGTFACALILGVPVLVSAALAVLAGMLLTGGLHEDGLADVCDGFGSGAARTRTLEIMRDSRLGTFGAAGLGIGLLLRIAALAAIPDPWLGLAAMVAVHALSRASIAVMQRTTPRATESGLGAEAGVPTTGRTLIAAVLGLASLLPLAHTVGAPPLSIAAIVTLPVTVQAAALVALRSIAIRRIGGYTGDVLGASEQISQMALLVGFSALLSNPEVIG